MEAYFASFPIWANFLLFSLGIAIITKGADWFTDGAVGVAEITGIPKVVVGATLVSLATTAPEFSVSVIAAWLDHPATSVGNAVGSTICNIGLILAVAFLLDPVSLSRKEILPKGVFMLALGALVVFMGWNGELTGAEGLVLFALVPVFLWFGMKQGTWADFDFGSAMMDRKSIISGCGSSPGRSQSFSEAFCSCRTRCTWPAPSGFPNWSSPLRSWPSARRFLN